MTVQRPDTTTRSARPGVGIREVSQLTLRAWWNQILLDLGGSTVQRAVFVWGAVAVLGLWAVGGVISMVLAPVAQRPDQALVAVLGQQLILVSFSLGPVIMAVLLVFAPPRGRVEETLQPLPIGRRTIMVGTELPLLSIAIVTLSAVIAPLIASSARLMATAMAVLFCLLVVSAATFGIAVGWLLFRGVGYLSTRLMRVPVALSRSIAGLACIGLSLALLAVSGLGTVDEAPAPVHWIQLETTSALGVVQAIGTSLLFFIGAAVFSWITTLIPDGADMSPAQTVAWGRRIPTAGSLHLWRTEFLQWIRHPLVVATETLMLLTVVLCMVVIPRDNQVWLLLAPLLVIASTTGSAVFAWGLNRPSLWVYTVQGGVPIERIFRVKITCAAMISTCMAALTLVLVLVKVPDMVSLLGVILPLCLLGFASSFLAGMVFPVDQQQSLTSALALLGSVMVTLGVGLLLGQLDALPQLLRSSIAFAIGLGVLVLSYIYAKGSTVHKLAAF